MSAISSITFLNKFNIRDMSSLEEKSCQFWPWWGMLIISFVLVNLISLKTFNVEKLHGELKTTLQIKLYQNFFIGSKQSLVTSLINITVFCSLAMSLKACQSPQAAAWVFVKDVVMYMLMDNSEMMPMSYVYYVFYYFAQMLNKLNI